MWRNIMRIFSQQILTCISPWLGCFGGDIMNISLLLAASLHTFISTSTVYAIVSSWWYLSFFTVLWKLTTAPQPKSFSLCFMYSNLGLKCSKNQNTIAFKEIISHQMEVINIKHFCSSHHFVENMRKGKIFLTNICYCSRNLASHQIPLSTFREDGLFA